MATLNELAYNVLNIARGGIASDDDRLNIRQIKFWIGYYRAWSLKEEIKKGKGIDPQMVQDLGCLKLESIDKANCPEVLWGCEVKRVKIPKLVDLPNNRGLVFIGLVDKTSPIIITPPNVASYKTEQRFTGNMRRAYIIGEHVYVTDPCNEDIQYINVRGVFDTPQNVEITNEDGSIDCTTDDTEYPMPESYIPIIVASILERELHITARSTNDENNDSREPNTAINDQQQAP